MNNRLYQCRIQMCFGTAWTVWAPKKFLYHFFHVFHLKTKSNIFYGYLETKIFSGDIFFSNIFGPSATTIWGFWVSLNYPTLNLKKKKKRYAQKTSWCGTVYSHLYLHLNNIFTLKNIKSARETGYWWRNQVIDLL